MKTYGRIGLFLVGLFLIFSSSYAAINLELTQGKSAAIPISIVPFANEQQAMAAGNQTLSTIIKNDLQNSGEFATKAPGLTGPMPSDASQVDNNYWRKQGVNDVVVGSVKQLDSNRYQVSFQLVGIFNQGSVLAGQTFTVDAAGLRRLAHFISDTIYQKLTGVRGVFSTEVTYVLVKHLANGQSQYTLEVADADGFNPRPLLTSIQPIMSPTWSPDGRQIAYVSFESQVPAIYLQNLASGSRQMISNYPGINGAPAFSPDGKKMAIVLTLTTNPKIYLMSVGGGHPTQLTQGFAIDTEPSWSVDGRSLLFTSNTGGSPQIYRYDFASGQTQRVSFDGDYNARASFLPDGKGMIMMHRVGGLFTIARQDFDTGRIQVLTQTGLDDSPSLSPNGKMVIYGLQMGGHSVLAMVSTDGRIKLQLPARDGDVQEPAWSPYLG